MFSLRHSSSRGDFKGKSLHSLNDYLVNHRSLITSVDKPTKAQLGKFRLYPTIPYPFLPYPTLPYPTTPLTCPTIPYPTLPYPTLPCPYHTLSLPYPYIILHYYVLSLPYHTLSYHVVSKPVILNMQDQISCTVLFFFVIDKIIPQCHNCTIISSHLLCLYSPACFEPGLKAQSKLFL